MVTPRAKKILLAFLVGAFAVQTALVYSDEPTGPINEAALRGRTLWHEHGCQVCHQFYGQGGFLGPDLTNAYSRVDSARLRSMLTIGSGQMPAFTLTDGEIADVRAFLASMDRPDLGWGQLRLAKADDAVTPWVRFGEVVTPLLNDRAGARRGWEAMQQRICAACHLPLAASPAGAPDLSRAVERMTEAELRTVLAEGRLAGGMPPPAPAFSSDEVNAVVALLRLMNEFRDQIDEDMAASEPDRTVRWGDIPWWEYR